MSNQAALFDPESNTFAKITKSGGLVVVPGTPNANEVSPQALSSTTLSNVGSSISSVVLAASNPNRKALVIVNDSMSALYVKYAATAASSVSYTFKIAAGLTLIMDSSLLYTGEIQGIWSSVDGSARVTEFV